MSASPLRLGRISYLNVLPIYHPLEAGWMPHDFAFTAGPPAVLNDLIRSGGLDMSSVSCVEYGRHPELYRLMPDLAIGSRGPVKSVLLLSRVDPRELGDKTILVTAETHTSATLLRVLLDKLYHVRPAYRIASATVREALAAGDSAPAVLAIGDEALSLRGHADFPWQLDLGELWREMTGLPFVFGVWVARREACAARPDAVAEACRLMVRAKEAGVAAVDAVVELTSPAATGMTKADLRRYYECLSYDLGAEEQAGLRTFFALLTEHGVLERAPELDIIAV